MTIQSISTKSSFSVSSKKKSTDVPPLKKKSESTARLSTHVFHSKTIRASEDGSQMARARSTTTSSYKSHSKIVKKRKIDRITPISKEVISSDSKKKKLSRLELHPREEEGSEEFWNNLPQSFWEQVDARVEESNSQSQKQDQKTLSTNTSVKQTQKEPDGFWNNLPPSFWIQLDALEKGHNPSPNNETITSTVSRRSRLSKTHPKHQQEYIGARIERISGSAEHIEELVSLIDSSNNKLEIFSWTLGYLDKEVFDSLLRANERDVQIILTVRNVKREPTYDLLEDVGIQVNVDRPTHTKFLVVDESTALIGSYNFLGANSEDEEVEGVGEDSFRISGNTDLVKRIRGRIYHDLICYERRKPRFLNPLCVNLGCDSNFHLLTNLFHHETFLKSMCKIAKRHIIIYSPFVHYKNAFKRLKVIETTVATVKLLIHVLPQHAKHLKWALDKLPKLKARTTIKKSFFHRKSLIIDPECSEGCFFSSGSFNWLSATPDEKSDASNQETTIVFSGSAGRKIYCFNSIDH